MSQVFLHFSLYSSFPCFIFFTFPLLVSFIFQFISQLMRNLYKKNLPYHNKTAAYPDSSGMRRFCPLVFTIGVWIRVGALVGVLIVIPVGAAIASLCSGILPCFLVAEFWRSRYHFLTLYFFPFGCWFQILFHKNLFFICYTRFSCRSRCRFHLSEERSPCGPSSRSRP